jgi:hypothetical protein
MHVNEFNAKPGFKFILNDWVIEVLGSFGPDPDFINIDLYSMFEPLSTTLWRGFSGHSTEETKPFYLLDKKSGNRIRIYPPGTWKREDFDVCPDCANGDFIIKDGKEEACDNVLYHTT